MCCRVSSAAITFCAVIVPIRAEAENDGRANLVFCCSANNDLYRVVTAAGEYPRSESASDAVGAAADGAGVLILASSYPKQPTAIDLAVFELAAKKKLRLYVEYPGRLPGAEVGKPRSTHVERGVIASDFFGKHLEKLQIVPINGLHYVPVEAKQSHMVAARVAGFDTAVYGLPDRTSPILFEMPNRSVLVATTKLSHFVTGRYAPRDSWRKIWRKILAWLSPNSEVPPLRWTPSTIATYTRTASLPEDYERQAIRRGIEWYGKAKMIVHPSFQKQVAGRSRIEQMPADWPLGDGSLGSMEAVISVIHRDGTQAISSVQRGDCICETAMAMAFSGKLLGDKTYSKISRNLLDYYLFKSDARKRQRGDPRHGAFGLIAWGITTPAWYVANYGDDNARQMLGTLATAALSGDSRWDEAMMMCLLANLRTTGRFGFRGSRVDINALGGGWERYFRGKPIHFAPHFEAYLWACYLWAYEQTGDELFLNRAEIALKMTMAHHTDGWRWTNGLAQERARIVLPLAWLVRVKDTSENRAMLRKAVDGLLSLQDKCGAIREELGRPGKGLYPPPRSNTAYGTNEASLIAENGDPVADLLYTTNFAFLALHEAAAATGDEDILEAENRLAEFLCRIQVKSAKHPQIDGGWFRAFDFKRWEHWGCNADHGWGAWAIESGWTQGWIISVLAMRQMNTSLWDLTHESKIEQHYEALRKQMLPAEEVARLEAGEAKKVNHGAIGKAVRLTAKPSSLYPGLGAATLVDGKVSGPDHTSGLWLGFHADDLEAVIDLGQPETIERLGVRLLQSISVGIYLPNKVVFEVSNDGKTFSLVSSRELKDYRGAKGIRVQSVYADKLKVDAHYVRIRAESVRTIPAGHRAAGLKAWLFADEVLVKTSAK